MKIQHTHTLSLLLTVEWMSSSAFEFTGNETADFIIQ